MGLVATTDGLYDEMAGTLEKVGVPPDRLRRLSLPEAQAGLPRGVDVLVAPPRLASGAATPGASRVIEFRHAMDDQSMRAVRAAVEEARRRRDRDAAPGTGPAGRSRTDRKRRKVRART